MSIYNIDNINSVISEYDDLDIQIGSGYERGKLEGMATSEAKYKRLLTRMGGK